MLIRSSARTNRRKQKHTKSALCVIFPSRVRPLRQTRFAAPYCLDGTLLASSPPPPPLAQREGVVGGWLRAGCSLRWLAPKQAHSRAYSNHFAIRQGVPLWKHTVARTAAQRQRETSNEVISLVDGQPCCRCVYLRGSFRVCAPAGTSRDSPECRAVLCILCAMP